MQKKVLFLVSSPFQLFNAIILRMTERSEDECDLLLRSAVPWNEKMLQQLADEKLFGAIIRPDFTQAERDFWSKSVEDRNAIINDPVLYYGESPIEPVYDEFFAALDSVAWKLLYHYEVLRGKCPDIIQFDEGTRSYSMDYKDSDSAEYYRGAYAEKPYSKAIRQMYLYRPELYGVTGFSYELKQMPDPRAYPQVKDALLRVFGVEPLPKEKYIYFEDSFFIDRRTTNDFSLFEQVAAAVGKENIIVKTHPRADCNRFAMQGYKTVGATGVPWEVQLLAGDIESKVLISVTSTAILSPYMVFGSNMHVISLNNMFRWTSALHQDAGFAVFFGNLQRRMNADEVRLHMPCSAQELQELLTYLKMNEQAL